MKVSTLHLSDLHISTKQKGLEELAKNIASTCFESFRNCDHFLIIITGDIAYSGKKEEYNLADVFLKSLKSFLKNESEVPIEILLAPGNHDCDFSESDGVRDSILESIKNDPEKANDESIINLCTKIQSNFFSFRKSFESKNIIYSDNLWTEVYIPEIDINISIINAAWMSSLKEKQGELVFPISKYLNILEKNNTFRLTLIHHPLNWYCQQTYHQFRMAIQQHSDVIYSGHEHSPNTTNISSSSSGKSISFESPALIPHNPSDPSGYSIQFFDFVENTINQKSYNCTNHDIMNEVDIPLSGNDYKLPIKNDFLATLSDTGATILHPCKKDVTIEDVFIELELKCSDTGDIYFSSDIETINKRTLIMGDEQSGKTKLLHSKYLEFVNECLYPVYINSDKLKRTTESNFIKLIENEILNQYKDPKIYKSAPKRKRAILIDNIQNIGLKNKGSSKIIEYIDNNFSTAIFTSDDIIDESFIDSSQFSELTENNKTYKILDFGSNRRHQLIKKWHSHSEEINASESSIHQMESIIDSVLGRNLIPSRPIYLLTLLQSSSSQDQSKLHSSGMSYYYQYLITKSFEEAGVGQSSLDELFNYLSNLAWYYHNQAREFLTLSELENFNELFSKTYTKVNLERQITILKRARIIRNEYDDYSFYYPYIKFFFLGKYFADNIDDQEINNLINSYCKDLHIRSNSNLILFLTHHRNTDWILSRISENLNSCFENHKEIEFNNNSDFLNNIVNKASEIAISELNIEKNQSHQRDIKDSNNENLEEIENDTEKLDQSTLDLFMMLRSTEVLGQILKNYYGSLKRENKQIYIKSISNAPLRILSFVFDRIIKEPDEIKSKIEEKIKSKTNLSSEESKNEAGKIISEIISGITTGIVIKTAESIGSDKLLDDIETISHNNNAYKLLLISIYLISPKTPPIDKIKSLLNDISGNNLAENVIQNLALYHIHMFSTPEKIKMALGSLVGIRLENIKLIKNKKEHI